MLNTHIRKLIISATGASGIFLFLLITNPRSLSAPMLLLLPVLVAVTLYTICKLLLEVFSSMSGLKIRTVSLVLSAGPTLLMLLGSLGQLGVQDFMLAFSLIAGLSWYIMRVQAIRV